MHAFDLVHFTDNPPVFGSFEYASVGSDLHLWYLARPPPPTLPLVSSSPRLLEVEVPQDVEQEAGEIGIPDVRRVNIGDGLVNCDDVHVQDLILLFPIGDLGVLGIEKLFVVLCYVS